MVKFLAGSDLSSAIKKITSGSDVRIASAFWGKDASKDLRLRDKADFRAICDLSMGGTNPIELTNLGAPDNPNIKSYTGLHAKVYISNDGAVVCSANASSNGIGFLDAGARLFEAGIYVPRTSDAYSESSSWFEKLWSDDRCVIVDESSLQWAKTLWKRGNYKSRAPSSNFLVAALHGSPRLADWGFVFTNSTMTKKQEKEAKDFNPDADDFYSDWGEIDIARWPRRFYGLHLADDDIIACKRIYIGPGRPPKGVKTLLLANEIAGNIALTEGDKEIARGIFSKIEKNDGRLIENSIELRKLTKPKLTKPMKF